MFRTILMISLFAIASACTKTADVGGFSGPGTVTVATATVELRPVIDQIQALGTASANESVDIRPRVASLVTRIGFEEGQRVSAGQLLIELENSEIRAGLELAKASLSESRSQYERSRSLASTKAVSASSLEELLAEVQVAEAQVHAAEARLKNTRIVAPFSGRAGLRNVSPGSFVDSGTVITTLDDVDTIKLDFAIPETFLTVVNVGMSIRARSNVYPDRDFQGTIESIDTRVDRVSRSVRIRALIDNETDVLKPGMFMTINLQADKGLKLLIPEQAVVPEGSDQFVFVVTDGIAERRRVEIGQRRLGEVVIDAGLSAGETIVTEGSQRIRDGSSVSAKNQSETGATG